MGQGNIKDGQSWSERVKYGQIRSKGLKRVKVGQGESEWVKVSQCGSRRVKEVHDSHHTRQVQKQE